MERHTLFGRDHTGMGELGSLNLSDCSGILSRGLDSPAPKKDPNEDAVGVARSSGGCTVGVVADAHFGRESAELVVQGVLSQVFRSEGPSSAHSFVERVGMSLAMVAQQLRQLRTDSACAVVVAWVCQDDLIWLSVGDCRLFRVDQGGQTQQVSPVEQQWMGHSFHPRVLHWGRETLSSGDRLLLCTDGLPECRYGQLSLRDHEIGPIAAEGSLVDAARNLAEAALAGGGEDNIGLLLIGTEAAGSVG